MSSIFIVISISYIILIIWLIIGFEKIDIFNEENEMDNITFSILIPFRNEEDNLRELIESFNKINYNKNLFEIIFINDASEDDSVNIIKENINKNIDFQLIDNIRTTNSPKKDAITLGIQKSNYLWIVTTDADCTVHSDWLKTLNSFILKNKNTEFIASPVNYTCNGTFLQKFQKVDFLSLIGSTIGGFGNKKAFLCNGANLCYTKSIFEKVNGFIGNNTISSGDDLFLMEKILRLDKSKVDYLKSTKATVYTKPKNTLKELIQQRIRWTSKTGNSKNIWIIIIGLLVFGYNFLISIGWFWFFITEKNKKIVILIFLLFFILKILFDYVLLKKTFLFFKENVVIKDYLIIAWLHPFFITVIPILSLLKKYQWKGRSYYK